MLCGSTMGNKEAIYTFISMGVGFYGFLCWKISQKETRRGKEVQILKITHDSAEPWTEGCRRQAVA
jgi:hypothetical protein